MVVALDPCRFYGGVLPRPRVFPGDRVDPPAPVKDALLCWARDAHWSMGGLGAKRLRLQGRIEGNLVKLRRTARHDARVSAKSAKSKAMRWEEVEVGEPGTARSGSGTPPSASTSSTSTSASSTAIVQLFPPPRSAARGEMQDNGSPLFGEGNQVEVSGKYFGPSWSPATILKVIGASHFLSTRSLTAASREPARLTLSPTMVVYGVLLVDAASRSISDRPCSPDEHRLHLLHCRLCEGAQCQTGRGRAGPQGRPCYLMVSCCGTPAVLPPDLCNSDSDHHIWLCTVPRHPRLDSPSSPMGSHPSWRQPRPRRLLLDLTRPRCLGASRHPHRRRRLHRQLPVQGYQKIESGCNCFDIPVWPPGMLMKYNEASSSDYFTNGETSCADHRCGSSPIPHPPGPLHSAGRLRPRPPSAGVLSCRAPLLPLPISAGEERLATTAGLPLTRAAPPPPALLKMMVFHVSSRASGQRSRRKHSSESNELVAELGSCDCTLVKLVI